MKSKGVKGGNTTKRSTDKRWYYVAILLVVAIVSIASVSAIPYLRQIFSPKPRISKVQKSTQQYDVEGVSRWDFRFFVDIENAGIDDVHNLKLVAHLRVNYTNLASTTKELGTLKASSESKNNTLLIHDVNNDQLFETKGSQQTPKGIITGTICLYSSNKLLMCSVVDFF